MLRPSDCCRLNCRQAGWIAVAATIVASSAVALALQEPAPDKPPKDRLFEMRTYIANEGKIGELHKRFREHTLRLFEKHGMTNIGYWTPTEGEEAHNTLVYLLAYPSNEEREKSWQAFREDPEWEMVRTESEKNGALVSKVISQMLKPTDYSAIK
ncbi:MAG: NIPSNAP family protein [Pirellulales bacterium]